MGRKLTTEDFIIKAKLKHFNKYCYDKTIYTGSKNKIIIICPFHGEFQQIVERHLQGAGCIKCGWENSRNKQVLNTEQFVNKSKEINGDKYLYNNTKYIDAKKTVIITCKIHGDFSVRASSHLEGWQCKKCGRKYNNRIGYQAYDTQSFIDKVRSIHGDKYNYNKVIYTGYKDKLIIICNKCKKEFKQKAVSHIIGQGCSRCNISKNENLIETILLKNNLKYTPQYSFKNCKDIKRLRFDFAIYIDNKILLIEYNGEQHYKSFYRYTPEKVIDIQKKDKIKINYCIDNNIPLLVIPYWDKDKCEALIQKFLAKYAIESKNDFTRPKFRGIIDSRNL